MNPQERFWSKVSKTETCWLWTGAIVKNPQRKEGYGQFRLNRTRRIAAHRYAYELIIGPIPPGLQLDHLYTCPKSCVNPAHLRPATNKQNRENVTFQANNTSGVRGVSWQKDHNRWRAVVHHNGKNVHVGYFQHLKDAERAVVAHRNTLFTHNDFDKVVTL